VFDAIFRGHRIKVTEKSVVLHVALKRRKGLAVMKTNIDQSRAPESNAKNPEHGLVSKPDSEDDLKFLRPPDVEKRLRSSAKGLSQAEAQKRLAKSYGSIRGLPERD
jgi:hypothetical protein